MTAKYSRRKRSDQQESDSIWVHARRDHIGASLANFVLGAEQVPGRADVVRRGHDGHLDWAFVRREPASQVLYLVRETKGGDRIEDLQWETEGGRSRH